MDDIKKVKAAILTNDTGTIKHQMGIVEPRVSREHTVTNLLGYKKEVLTKIEIGLVHTVPSGNEEKYFLPRAESIAKKAIMKYLYGDIRNELANALYQIQHDLGYVDSMGLQMLKKLCSELNTIDEG